MVGIEEALGSDLKPNRRETMGELAWMESMMGWLMAVGLGRSLKVKLGQTTDDSLGWDQGCVGSWLLGRCW